MIRLSSSSVVFAVFSFLWLHPVSHAVTVCLYDSSRPYGESKTEVDINPEEVTDLQEFVETFGGAYSGRHHLSHYFAALHWTRVTLSDGTILDVGIPKEDLIKLFLHRRQ